MLLLLALCAHAAPGNVATLLLTLGDEAVPESVGAQLARNAADWAGEGRVLVVRDDAHSDENSDDTERIARWLRDGGRQVELRDEPSDGLSEADVQGFQVVWFSNPGHRVDDALSLRTLLSFAQAGGGVVLQGDDMTRETPGLTELNGLVHLNNGTHACGTHIDNGVGDVYEVTIEHAAHPLARALSGEAFLYSNDIDHSALGAGDLTVVATALPKGKPTCMVPIPVIVGRTLIGQ